MLPVSQRPPRKSETQALNKECKHGPGPRVSSTFHPFSVKEQRTFSFQIPFIHYRWMSSSKHFLCPLSAFTRKRRMQEEEEVDDVIRMCMQLSNQGTVIIHVCRSKLVSVL